MVSRYAGQHQSIRRHTREAAYGTPCVRCGRLMVEGQYLDLDHTDDGDGYRGWAHSRCNRRAGGQLGAARRATNQRARRTEKRRMLDMVVLGLQISEDRAHTSIAAAGRLDGDFVGVQLAAYLDGVATAVAEVLALRAEWTVSLVVVDPHSPAATLIRPLTDAGVAVTEPSTSDVVIANGTFTDLVAARKLRIAAHPMLDAAARHGTQRALAGARAWERRGSSVDIGPIDAATMAVWGLLNRSAPFFAAKWTQ